MQANLFLIINIEFLIIRNYSGSLVKATQFSSERGKIGYKMNHFLP